MIEIILPAMGEGIIEAEITRWLVREGEKVDKDQPVVEVATDKVDSEIPSPGSGIIHKVMFSEGDTAKVGQVMALIATPEEDSEQDSDAISKDLEAPEQKIRKQEIVSTGKDEVAAVPISPDLIYKDVAFISPVIRKLAVEHEISPAELGKIKGSGLGGRITRSDVLGYLSQRSIPESEIQDPEKEIQLPEKKVQKPGKEIQSTEKEISNQVLSKDQIYGTGPTTIEEMDRKRKLIADHMTYSRKVAPHVSSFVESDVTEMIRWRNRVKEKFLKKYNQKLTITTLILEAVIKTLKEYPRINVSVDGYQIIHKHNINLGMATALPNGNLIVPVIHDADNLNLGGLAAKVNDLAGRARTNKLQPAEIQGGTFTVTNMGQVGNISGTPIINQPQVAILAIGAIAKKPAVVETSEGDTIGIRHMLVLSLSYDHRVVDGALGGMFLKSIGDRLQDFDPDRSI